MRNPDMSHRTDNPSNPVSFDFNLSEFITPMDLDHGLYDEFSSVFFDSSSPITDEEASLMTEFAPSASEMFDGDLASISFEDFSILAPGQRDPEFKFDPDDFLSNSSYFFSLLPPIDLPLLPLTEEPERASKKARISDKANHFFESNENEKLIDTFNKKNESKILSEIDRLRRTGDSEDYIKWCTLIKKGVNKKNYYFVRKCFQPDYVFRRLSLKEKVDAFTDLLKVKDDLLFNKLNEFTMDPVNGDNMSFLAWYIQTKGKVMAAEVEGEQKKIIAEKKGMLCACEAILGSENGIILEKFRDSDLSFSNGLRVPFLHWYIQIKAEVSVIEAQRESEVDAKKRGLMDACKKVLNLRYSSNLIKAFLNYTIGDSSKKQSSMTFYLLEQASEESRREAIASLIGKINKKHLPDVVYNEMEKAINLHYKSMDLLDKLYEYIKNQSIPLPSRAGENYKITLLNTIDRKRKEIMNQGQMPFNEFSRQTSSCSSFFNQSRDAYRNNDGGSTARVDLIPPNFVL